MVSLIRAGACDWVARLGIIAAVSVGAATSAPAETPPWASGLPPAEWRLLDDYRANSARLREFYDNIEMEAIHRMSVRGDMSKDNPKGIRVSRLVYRAGGSDLYRIDSFDLNHRNDAPTGRSTIHLLGLQGFLRLERDRADKPYVLTDVVANPDEGWSRLTIFHFQWAPYTFYTNVPLTAYLDAQPPFLKTYRIDKVGIRKEKGESLVVVDWHGISKSHDSGCRGQFVLYRDRSWALKEYQHTFDWVPPSRGKPKSPPTIHGLREYEGMRNGVPLLKRVEYWEERAPEHVREFEDVYEVQRVVVGAVAQSEFSPSALSLTMGAQQTNWILRLVCLLVGVLLVALYFVLRRRKRT